VTDPFEAPLAEHEPVVVTWGMVLGSWGLGGAALGTAAGLTAQLFEAPSGFAPGLGIGGMLAGAVLGAGALVVERDRSLRRPLLVDGVGTPQRPLHGAVLGVPVLVAVPSLLWLVGACLVGFRQPLAAGAFGMVALVVGWAGLRVLGRHRLTRALEALELGRTERGVPLLHALAEAWWPGRSTRAAARLNLALLALNAGNGDEAIGWAAPIRGGAAGAWAATARALGLLLRGDPLEDVEACLVVALGSPGARAVRPEADAVRVLVVWRRDGPEAAREVGEALLDPTSTALHRGLLASLRARAGDGAGAAALRTPEVGALVSSGLGSAIPELRPS
jgi:hypothetical protein